MDNNEYDYEGIFDTDPFGQEHNDDDLTLLKTVHTSECNGMGDNCANPSPKSYTTSLEVDLDTSITCGQKDTSYRVDDVVIDRLDLELHNLPKDLYIKTLLDLSNHSEEVLSQYRDVLSTRAKSTENGPCGMLRSRRKPETLAKDCFDIHQFLNYNINDINTLYRRCPTTPANNSNTRNSSAKHDEITNTLLREAMVKMQADVLSLKSTVTQNQKTIKSVCENLKVEVDSIKTELQQCTNVISANIRSIRQGENEQKLSDCLNELSRVVHKLEMAKGAVSNQVSTLQTSVRDNSANIDRLQDFDHGEKRDCQKRVKELRINLTDDISHLKDNSISKTAHDKDVRQINSQIKTLTEKHKSADGAVTQAIQTLNTEFKEKMSEMSDIITSTIKNSFESFGGAYRAPYPVRNIDTAPLASGPISKPNTDDDLLPSSAFDTAPLRDTVKITNNTSVVTNRKTVPADKVRHSGSSNANFQIPVHVTQTQSTDSTDDFHVYRSRKGHFRAAKPKQYRSYVITGIHNDSDQEGLESFLENDLNIKFKFAKFLRTGRTDCKVAQITVDIDQSEFIEKDEVWPEGIFCRPWLNKTDYIQRFQR